MSSRQKVYSGAEAVEKYQRAGWRIARQKGSHIMLVKNRLPLYPCITHAQGAWRGFDPQTFTTGSTQR